VVVRVTPYDGKVEGKTVLSAVQEISMAPPQDMQVELTPTIASPGDPLVAKVMVRGPRREDLKFRYVWRVNGEVVEGAASHEFDTDRLRRGDRVEVEVTVDVGREQGPSIVAQEVVLRNRPPQIVSSPPEKLATRGRYRYPVKAVDPDGDPLEFRLEGSVVPGMRIHPTTGVLEWSFTQPPEEVVVIDIRVSDGQGGEAEQRYDFQVSPAEQSQ
jgi:hypothetical protein